MKHKISPELERYLAHCKELYEDMVRDGTWPWKDQDLEPDSQEPEGMVESEDNPQDI